MKKFLLAFFLSCLLPACSWAQSAPLHYLSAGTNNSTSVRNARAVIRTVAVINTTSTLYYLKFYDKATAPTCGTDIPVLTIPVPNAAGAGGGLTMSSVDGLLFGNGLGFCLVGGIADNDNSVAATGVAINLGVSSN